MKTNQPPINLETTIQDRILRVIVISGCLLIACVLLIFFGHRAYVRWQAPRLARQAQSAIFRGDLTTASLLAQRALQLDRNNPDAARAVADMADKQGAEDALGWRQLVVKVLPNSMPDRLALVRTALRLGQTKIAEAALAAVPNREQENAEYHACAAQLALALNKLEDADFHYQRATELDPSNVVFAFNRAVVELRFLEKRDVAEATLRRFSENEKVRLLAQKALLADAIEHLNWNSALPLADAIVADPKSEFSDRIVRLDVLRHAFNPSLSTSLEKMQKDGATKPADAAALLIWMEQNEQAREGVKWADGLRPEIRDSSPVKAALAFCFLTLGDWNSVEALVRSGNWGILEYLRLAIFARALKERNNLELFRAKWEAAVAAAAANPVLLNQLLQVATTWGWKNELREIYWVMVAQGQNRTTALRWLAHNYSTAGNTADLKRVVDKILEDDPNDFRAKNNSIMLAFLLGKAKENESETARQLFEQNPNDSTVVSTYAYSLYAQHRLDEALKAMRSLPKDKLEEPATAAYYGILLAAKGEKTEAAKFLDLAQSANLLPEEKQLVREARQRTDLLP